MPQKRSRYLPNFEIAQSCEPLTLIAISLYWIGLWHNRALRARIIQILFIPSPGKARTPPAVILKSLQRFPRFICRSEQKVMTLVARRFTVHRHAPPEGHGVKTQSKTLYRPPSSALQNRPSAHSLLES